MLVWTFHRAIKISSYLMCSPSCWSVDNNYYMAIFSVSPQHTSFSFLLFALKGILCQIWMSYDFFLLIKSHIDKGSHRRETRSTHSSFNVSLQVKTPLKLAALMAAWHEVCGNHPHSNRMIRIIIVVYYFEIS